MTYIDCRPSNEHQKPCHFMMVYIRWYISSISDMNILDLRHFMSFNVFAELSCIVNAGAWSEIRSRGNTIFDGKTRERGEKNI